VYPESYSELEGIANVLGLETSVVVTIAHIYEVISGCTSIIARTRNNEILHLRHLDFYPFDLRDIAYIGIFKRGGQTKFIADMFGGINFVATGYKPNRYSISLNSRSLIPSHLPEVMQLFISIANTLTTGRMIRETLERAETFGEAVQKIKNAALLTGSYIAIAGTGYTDGVIITHKEN
jgi:hypothetical protein